MIVAAPFRTLDSGAIRAALALPGAGEGRDYAGVSTDSRTLTPGELFVALAGERHDAADFLEQAAERGAPGAVVPAGREDPSLPLEYFPVPDPLAALRTLAAERRRASTAAVVAITGSSGKTTVKEMVACALEGTRVVYRTEGNLNSQVGLPLTILRAPPDADAWVLELGASEPGEIARLTEIARPDHAVVTTVGSAHLEHFGDLAGVLREKLDMVRGTAPRGTVVVGDEPPELGGEALALRPDAIVAGLGERATYRPDDVEIGPDRIRFRKGGTDVEVGAGGEHHVRDALIAAALAEGLGVDLAAAARGLSRYRPLGMRGAVRRVGGLVVLADCYNANPDSFAAAIAQCRDLFPGRRRAAFVGSMLELGPHEAAAHDRVATLLLEAGFELIAATGIFAEARFDAPSGVAVVRATEPAEAWGPFAEGLRGDELVLVKASRGARLERAVGWLEERFGGEG